MSDSTGGGGAGGIGLSDIGGFLVDLFGTGINTTVNSDETDNLSEWLNQNIKNGADPDVIASLKAAAAKAGSNANNPTATNDLVSNIFKQSAIAFAPVEAKSNSTGIYSGSTLDLLKGQQEALATGDASQAVLNYKTQQSTLQGSILDALAAATKTTATNTTTKQSGTKDITGNTQGRTGGIFNSQVCTEMMRQKRLPVSWWKVGKKTFDDYDLEVKVAYYYWSYPLLQVLKTRPQSLAARVICKLFYARAEFFAWRAQLSGAQCNINGFIVHLLMAAACAIVLYVPTFREASAVSASQQINTMLRLMGMRRYVEL